MTPPRERVDETIDRVAAELTLVAADPTLPGRIIEQLAREPRLAFGWRLAIGAGAAAAAAMLAALMIDAPALPIDPADTKDAAAVSVASREIAAAPLVAPAAMVRTRERVARATALAHGASAVEPLAEFRQIDALPSLATLAVDDLNTDLLTIAPVDFAPLDLDDLVIGDVSGRDEPKE